MMYERPSPLERIDGRGVEASENEKRYLKSTREGEQHIPQVFANCETSPTSVESQRRLRKLFDILRKVLSGGQVAIVVIVPYTVHWVTPQSQQQLGKSAGDVSMIAEALEAKLGGPNSELVAEHVVRAATRAQLGIQNRNSIELHASSTKSYKVDLDCYFEDADIPAIVALLTPMKDSSKTGYEEVQLSSLRYHIGIMNSKDEVEPANSPSGYANYHVQNRHLYHHQHHPYANPAPQRLPHSRKFQGLSRRPRYDSMTEQTAGLEEDDGGDDDDEAETRSNTENHFIHDFIPSMICQELDYFYAMLPESDNDSFSHHELELSRSQSIWEHEQQAMDPDVVDPHIRMRLNQQRSLSPVLPRRPRDLAEVQAEMERSRLMIRGPFDTLMDGSGNPITHKKHGDIRCLECGTDTSPEWRKGPNGPKTLCNRCGLRFAKKLRQQK